MDKLDPLLCSAKQHYNNLDLLDIHHTACARCLLFRNKVSINKSSKRALGYLKWALFFKKWANPGLFFYLFSSFQHVTISIKIEKSVDGVLGSIIILELYFKVFPCFRRFRFSTYNTFRIGPFPASFLFHFSIKLILVFFQWLDLLPRSLVSEATTLPFLDNHRPTYNALPK